MSIRRVSKWLKQWSSYFKQANAAPRQAKRKRPIQVEELGPRIVLNSDWYLVPGSPLEDVTLTFKRAASSTPYKNELGYYVVSDDAGRVEGLLPSDAGYAAAANRSSKALFSTTSKTGATSKITVAGGSKLGFYLVQNSTSTNWNAKNPNNSLAFKPVMFFSYDGANPDGQDHVRTATVGSEMRFKWEDRTNLADRDFNDMQYSITAQRPKMFTPGEVGQVVSTTFQLSSLDSRYRNELGIFLVDDAKGTIDGIAPGTPGYTQVALTASTSHVLFARGAKKGTTVSVDLPSQQYFGFYLVQNTTTSNFLSSNPYNKKLTGKPNVFFSIPTANPDRINHVKWSTKSSNTIGFEDLWGGGDKDYNDLIAKFRYGAPSNPDNDAPTISDVLNQTASVSTSVGPIPFTINDDVTPASQLVVTAASSNTALLPVGNIVLSGSGSNRFVTLNPASGLSGIATVTLTVRDANGLTSTDTFTLTVTPGNTPPVISDVANQTTLVNTPLVSIPFTISDIETSASELILTATSSNPTLIPDGNIILGGSGNNRTVTLNPVAGQNGVVTITLTAKDPQGLTTFDTFVVTVNAASIPSGNFAGNTAFLYTGPNPVQTGVEPGTIDPIRAAVVRGKVIDRSSQPLPGVTVTILNHPEFGQTTTQADGTFSLAVNGGGLLTVVYTKLSYLTVQNQVNVPWRDYVIASNVVLTPLDGQVTTIDLSSTATFQVAQGSIMTDSDGTRQATLLFPQGTSAMMTLPDGSIQPLSTLNVRATEYTVGDTGPAAMPGTLPATSAYTYCVELSIDQAQAAGAMQVDFNQTIPFYVENFLNFPVGGIVPVGNYDRARGVWSASTNGVVIKVLSVTSGGADLDTNGDGNVDDDTLLAALGITDNEQMELATLYQPGQSLWRVPLTHFSIWDCNWPWGLADDAVPPDFDPDELKDNPTNNPNEVCQASTIGIENQTLGESIQITGTPFTLNYSSDRMPGNLAARTLSIPITAQNYPTSLQRIELTIEVAGRQFQESYAPSPNLYTTFTWDGYDAFGRIVNGSTQSTVKISYVYQAVYGRPVPTPQSFGLTSGILLDGNRARNEITLTKTFSESLGVANVLEEGVGGWTLNVFNSYDPVSKTLNSGTGHSQVTDNWQNAITRFAGIGSPGFSGDGGVASQAKLAFPDDVAIGPDGSVYIADSGNHRIRRVGADGIITTIAGNGSSGFSGDGGLASQAQLSSPKGVAIGPDGSVYIADSGNNRIRRMTPNGIITTIAGNGNAGSSGDGGAATQATLTSPIGVAVGPDGGIYFNANNRIRKVNPNGLVYTIVGSANTPPNPGCPECPGGPGGNGFSIAGFTIGQNGNLYYIEDGIDDRVRQVTADGSISTVAGIGRPPGFSGDGGPAIRAQLNSPIDVGVGPDGSLYIADYYNSRIRKVSPDGIISTIAGNGSIGFNSNGGPATSVPLTNPSDVAVGPDGTLYIVCLNEIRRVSPSQPDFTNTDILVPSKDGNELYHFDTTGRHLQTTDALSQAVIYTFGYDTAGHLYSITDGDGNITSIQRDANGNATAIVSPFGQRTKLALNAQGYLASVTNPANETNSFGYGNGGLLTSHTDARGNVSSMIYDDLGRLIYDEDDGGGSTTLVRESLGNGGYKVTTTNGMNGTRQYLVENLLDGSVRRTAIDGRGFATVTVTGTDGTETTTLPNGTISTTTYGPDPRFGMLAPIVAKQIVKVPSGLTSTTTATRTAVFSDPINPQSNLVSLTDTTTVNGQTFTTTYAAATHTVTTTSAEGRLTVTTLDDRGRAITIEVPGISPTYYDYDSKGRVSTISQGNRTVSYAYDTLGRLASITDPLDRVMWLAYDAANRIVSQTQPDGSVISFSYDADGNMLSLSPPGKPATTFEYAPHNELVSSTPPSIGANDDTTRYVYNLAHQLVKETLPGGDEINFAYCECGRLTSIAAPWGNYTYNYSDTTGELSSLQSPGGFTLSFGQDGFVGTSETMSGPVSGSVSWTYNNNFQVTSETVNGENPVSFTYDNDGLLIGAGNLAITRDAASGRTVGSTLGVVTDSFGYDPYGVAYSYQASISSSTAIQIAYTRDAVGRITRKVETIDGTTVTYDYGYDLKGQLVSVDQNGVSVQTYAYDSNGNRLSLITPSGREDGTYNAQDQLLTYGTMSYSYSRDGSLKSMTDSATGETTQYTYDAFGNLTEVNLPDGRTITYLIDGNNRRVGKKVDGVLTQGLLYDGKLTPVATVNSDGNIVERFVYATGINVPVYMIKGGIAYRIVTDHLGSVRLVINTATGQVAQRIDYDAFGRVTLDTDPGSQPFGYAGGLYDTNTRLVRFGARDYDAQIGRWMAKDPIGFGGNATNIYGYVSNSPITSIDSFGLQEQCLCQSYNEQNDLVQRIRDSLNRRKSREFDLYTRLIEIGNGQNNFKRGIISNLYRDQYDRSIDMPLHTEIELIESEIQQIRDLENALQMQMKELDSIAGQCSNNESGS